LGPPRFFNEKLSTGITARYPTPVEDLSAFAKCPEAKFPSLEGRGWGRVTIEQQASFGAVCSIVTPTLALPPRGGGDDTRGVYF